MSNTVVSKDLSEEVVARLQSLYNDKFDDICRFGDAGYLLPSRYKPHAAAVRAMPVRSSDVWLVTFPRSGTHMTAEMLWLLQNNLDYKKAAEIPLSERTTFIEIFSLYSDGVPIGYQVLADKPSPRLISTHLAFSLLPATLLDTAKVVYVARDPRDVAVSYFLLELLRLKDIGHLETFEQFWELFVDDLVVYAPFFAHLKEAWPLRNHPNMLFMFYEDIVKDMPSAVRRIGRFLGKECTEEEVSNLSDHMNIDNMRKNTSVQPDTSSGESLVFVRQGRPGGWRDHFDEAMRASAQKWMDRHLADTDIYFPEN